MTGGVTPSQGNKASTWESLIDHNKLPFMAMLRNLRNVIKANVNPRYHNMILGRLRSEKAVVNSKQFPFRFFSAYEVLTELIEPKPVREPRPGRDKKVCSHELLTSACLLVFGLLLWCPLSRGSMPTARQGLGAARLCSAQGAY